MHIATKMKQIINRALIKSGIRNPGLHNRHDWVGPGYHEMKRDFQITSLKSLGLQPRHVFLDLGCGTLRGGIPIIDYLETGNYWGVDVRSKVLSEARNELAEYCLQTKE